MKRLTRSLFGIIFLIVLIAVGGVFWYRGSLDNLIPYMSVDFERMIGITEKLKTEEYSKVTLTGTHNGIDFEQKYTYTEDVWVPEEEYEDSHRYTIKTSIYDHLMDIKTYTMTQQEKYKYSTNSRKFKVEFRDYTSAKDYAYSTFVYNRKGALAEAHYESVFEDDELGINVRDNLMIYYTFS